MRPRTFIRRHRALLQELALAADALRAGDDPEALHALRVASRRLRALHRPLAGRRRHDRPAGGGRSLP
jgi:CHAD domain-containing protein